MVQKIERFMPHLVVAFKNSIVGAFLIGMLFFGVEYVYERFSPDTWWVEYNSILTLPEYGVKEVPKFKSVAIYPKGGAIEWTDVLRCDTNNDGNFEFFSVYNSSANVSPLKEFPEVDPENILANGWRYQSQTPNMPAVCFLDSTSEIKTPLGLTKTEKILSGQFKIVAGER